VTYVVDFETKSAFCRRLADVLQSSLEGMCLRESAFRVEEDGRDWREAWEGRRHLLRTP
jgi:hypothetical protein